MKMRAIESRRRVLFAIDAAIGTILIACLALLASALLYGSPAKFFVPAAFVAVVVMIARRFGTLSGVLGSVAAAAVFACFLFRPFGTIDVANPAAREALQWLLLGGISLSFLFPPDRQAARRRRSED